MTKKFTQYFQNTPKYVPVLGAFLAGLIVAGIVYFVSRSPKADDNVALRAARIERIDGNVGIARPQAQEESAEPVWEEVTRNAPLTTGDRIYAREGSRAAVAFTGRNYARLDSDSALDVLSLADRRTQLALRDGSAIFDIGELEDDELFEVATPNGAFGFNEPGLYQMGIGDDGNTWISVLSGLAQVIGLEGSGEVGEGEMLTLVGQAASQILLSRLSPDYAGELVDDYYDYRYDDYDGRYRNYTAYQDDPYYYAPSRRSVSYRYVADDIPGIYDLDDYGDWTDIDGYGHCWTPRVENDWVPYRNGYWDVGSTYGPTWISQEPWGWAPYHYGRWAYVNQRQWVWVPEGVDQRAVYAPALVAFVPMTQSRQIGWVPLAPGEEYVPRYYDSDFQPRYFAEPEVVAQVVNVQQTYVNYNYPQAVTVVPVQDFTRLVEPGRTAVFNRQSIAQTQPVLDAYAIESVRNLAIANDNGRAKFRMERRGKNRDFNTPVVTSVEPLVIPGRENINDRVQVATVPERQRKNKLKVQQGTEVMSADTRQGLGGVVMPQKNSAVASQGREQQVAELAARSAQGDRTARRELKRLAREQGATTQGIQNPAVVQPTVQGREFKQMNPQQGAVQNPQKAQRQLERQQRRAMQEQQRQPMTQPAQELPREQRKAQKRAAQERNLMVQQQQAQQTQKQQRQAAAQQATQNVQAEQRRVQKQAARQQQANQQRQAEQVNQQRQQEQLNQQRQMKQQRKQQRQMQEQQQVQQVNQQRQAQEQQMRQQMKQQRRMQEQQQMQRQQPPAVVQPAERQQRKAERRAAQQQQASPQVVQPQQPRANKPVEHKGTPATGDAANQSQRRAEKAQRKAGKGNQ